MKDDDLYLKELMTTIGYKDEGYTCELRISFTRWNQFQHVDMTYCKILKSSIHPGYWRIFFKNKDDMMMFKLKY